MGTFSEVVTYGSEVLSFSCSLVALLVVVFPSMVLKLMLASKHLTLLSLSLISALTITLLKLCGSSRAAKTAPRPTKNPSINSKSKSTESTKIIHPLFLSRNSPPRSNELENWSVGSTRQA